MHVLNFVSLCLVLGATTNQPKLRGAANHDYDDDVEMVDQVSNSLEKLQFSKRNRDDLFLRGDRRTLNNIRSVKSRQESRNEKKEQEKQTWKQPKKHKLPQRSRAKRGRDEDDMGRLASRLKKAKLDCASSNGCDLGVLEARAKKALTDAYLLEDADTYDSIYPVLQEAKSIVDELLLRLRQAITRGTENEVKVLEAELKEAKLSYEVQIAWLEDSNEEIRSWPSDDSDDDYGAAKEEADSEVLALESRLNNLRAPEMSATQELMQKLTRAQQKYPQVWMQHADHCYQVVKDYELAEGLEAKSKAMEALEEASIFLEIDMMVADSKNKKEKS